jgi:hypothetical protein
MSDSEELKSQLHTQLRLFGSVEEQTEVFERFFAEEKDIAKMIRKRIADYNKPPKLVKEKATKAPRKGKAVVHQDELISQLIADANAEVAEPKANKADEKAAKLAEKETAKLAKEEAARLAKDEKEAKEEAARLAKVAKEEAARLAKEEKEAKEEAARLAKVAKEEAARLAKLAKEQEKTKKVKPDKKANASKPAPVEAPIEVPIVNEVVEKAIEAAPIAPVVEDELVAEVIEELAAMTVEVPPAKATNATKEDKPAKAAKAAKDPKAAKEPKAKAEKKTKTAKKTVEPAEPIEEEGEEIHTRIGTIGDKNYLIDQNFTVYDVYPPHDIIGVYNQETGAIDAL